MKHNQASGPSLGPGSTRQMKSVPGRPSHSSGERRTMNEEGFLKVNDTIIWLVIMLLRKIKAEKLFRERGLKRGGHCCPLAAMKS